MSKLRHCDNYTLTLPFFCTTASCHKGAVDGSLGHVSGDGFKCSLLILTLSQPGSWAKERLISRSPASEHICRTATFFCTFVFPSCRIAPSLMPPSPLLPDPPPHTHTHCLPMSDVLRVCLSQTRMSAARTTAAASTSASTRSARTFVSAATVLYCMRTNMTVRKVGFTCTHTRTRTGTSPSAHTYTCCRIRTSMCSCTRAVIGHITATLFRLTDSFHWRTVVF